MRNAITSAAILGAVAVSANPVAYGPLNSGWGRGSHASPSGYESATSTWSGSYPSSTGSSSGSGQVPFKFPLSNGFPDVDNATLRNIEEQAHGTLPNGPPVAHIAPGSATVFQLIRFNELFEVAFFTSLITNITSNVDGFGIDSQVLKNFVLETLAVVQGQEELHALGAGGILMNSGNDVPDPCEYIFPSDSFDSAIDFARTFTDVVLSTLQAGQIGLAAGGDDEFLSLLGAVQGQEGEQNGFYRSLLDLVPSELPFLTLGAPQFAFSTLNQNVIVKDSCKGKGNDDLFAAIPVFGILTVDTKDIKLENQNIQFTVETNSSESDISSWSVAFLNSQNVPITSPVTNVQVSDGSATFEAYFPAFDVLANGLTISAVTHGASSFANASDVAAATLFGPGLIEIN